MGHAQNCLTSFSDTHPHPLAPPLPWQRSLVVPTWPGGKRQPAAVAVDAVYLHEKPVHGVNCPQEVFEALESELDRMSKAAGGNQQQRASLKSKV